LLPVTPTLGLKTQKKFKKIFFDETDLGLGFMSISSLLTELQRYGDFLTLDQ
jgi:hypothetical protein